MTGERSRSTSGLGARAAAAAAMSALFVGLALATSVIVAAVVVVPVGLTVASIWEHRAARGVPHALAAVPPFADHAELRAVRVVDQDPGQSASSVA